MNWPKIVNGFETIWREKPTVIVLLVVGFVVFLFIVVDTRRHRGRRKGPGPRH